MGKFFNGLLIGVGISFLVAPMRGEEMRSLIDKRFKSLQNSLPRSGQNTQSPQQVSDSVSQATTQTGPVHSQMTERHPSPYAVHSHELDSTRRADTLKSVQGIVPEFQERLETEGITTVQQLLERTTTQQDRVSLASKVGTSPHLLKELATYTDLMRLKGMSAGVISLLDAAGVTGCEALHQRNAEHLHTTLVDLQVSRNIVQQPPDLKQTMAWIAEAKEISSPPAS